MQARTSFSDKARTDASAEQGFERVRPSLAQPISRGGAEGCGSFLKMKAEQI